MSDARRGDPREYGDRDRNDERPRVYDERDRDDHDPRDALMHDLDLPRGEERELVVDRDRVYELNGEDSRTLAAVGTFRVVPEQDLDIDEGTVHHLRDEGLVETVDLGDDERGLSLTKAGRDLLDSHALEPDREAPQAFHAGVSRPREIDHDSNLYATYRQEEARLRDEHGDLEIRRVILEQDLKREYQEFLQDHNRNRSDSDGRPDRGEDETFADLAREYIERHASKKRSGDEDIRILNGWPHKKKTGKKPHVGLVTRWGTRKVNDIKRRDVRDLLEEIAGRAPIMANRTLALVRKMFNFAIEHEWLEVNPCHMVKQPGQEKQRERVLSEDEIRRVWKAMDDESPLITTLFRIRLLTAQRGGEVHGAAWAELDLTSAWWTIPAERSKNGLADRVPLSPQAVRILKAWRASAGDSPWVFPSSRKNRPHIAHAQKAIERIADASDVEFRGHDLRRTAASLMVGAGVPRLVVSKILNHVETGVTAVYDRTATTPRSVRPSISGVSDWSRSSAAGGAEYWRSPLARDAGSLCL